MPSSVGVMYRYRCSWGTSSSSILSLAARMAFSTASPVESVAPAATLLMPVLLAYLANRNASSSGTTFVRMNSPARRPKAIPAVSRLSIVSTVNMRPRSKLHFTVSLVSVTSPST